jgi:hypothetical protein
MRKITEDICSAFVARRARTIGNSHTDGDALYLHGNKIAEHGEHDGRVGVFLTLAGWGTPTTRERVNGVLDMIDQRSLLVGFYQKSHEQYFSGVNIATNAAVFVATGGADYWAVLEAMPCAS